MAERTAEGGVRLSLILDKDGKPFVHQVNSAMSAATTAVERGGQRAGRSFGEVLGSGFFLKAAAATLTLRRLANSAGEASPQFSALKREVSETGKVLGTDLQFAIGGLLGTARPLLDWLQETSGAMRGVLGGTALASTAMGPFKLALMSLGVPGAQATAILLGLGAALGALAGKAGENAKEVARRTQELIQTALAAGERTAQASRDKLAEELAAQEKLLRSEQDRLRDIAEDQPAVDLLGSAGTAQTGFARSAQQAESELRRSVAERSRTVEDLRQQVTAFDQALAIFSRGVVQLGDADLTISDFIQRQQLAIATGEQTLEAARQAIQARRAELEKDRELLANTAAAVQDTDEVRQLFVRLAGGDEQKAAELRQKFLANELTQKQLLTQVEREIVSLTGTEVDLTDRLSQQAERLRTTELNRKVLQAQLVDALRGFGPVLEMQVLEEERRRLAIEEGGRAKTRILELDNAILALSQQIARVEEQRANAQRQEREAKWREEVTQWQQASLSHIELEMSLMRLSAHSEEQFRAQRIRALQEELGLRNLSMQAMRAELDDINLSAAIAPEQAARRRQQMGELIGLLQDARGESAGMGDEIRLLGSGLQQVATHGALAMVQMFTRGKAQVKDFAEFALETFERMFAELLAKQVVMAFIRLLSGGGGFTGSVGGSFPLPFDFGGGITRLGPRPNLPMLPQPANGIFGSAIESKLDRLAAAVEGLELRVAPLRLRGQDLYGSVQLAQASAPKLKS